MSQETQIILSRDVEAAIVPTGEPVTLKQGEEAQITQELGGAFTVIVNGNMFRIQANMPTPSGGSRRSPHPGGGRRRKRLPPKRSKHRSGNR